jgi:hypothetical protein
MAFFELHEGQLGKQINRLDFLLAKYRTLVWHCESRADYIRQYYLAWQTDRASMVVMIWDTVAGINLRLDWLRRRLHFGLVILCFFLPTYFAGAKDMEADLGFK